jgi:ribokinase
MPQTRCKTELQSFLTQPTKDCRVVVLPDFFLDRFINLKWDTKTFSRLVQDVAERGGGSLDGISQSELRGGNAINVASALASLGVNVTPIICTSPYGLHHIEYSFQNTPIDLSHVKTYGIASVTTALEFQDAKGKTNVMLRDLGSLADFGPANLDGADYDLISEADYVCLFNWAGTLRFGTELAHAVFEWTKSVGRGKTFYDTADPTPNGQGIPELMERVLKSDKVDVLSVNENEAVAFASFLDENLKMKRGNLAFAELAMEAARVLATHLHGRVDLHTTAFSATFRGKEEVVVPTFRVDALRATGSGDAWTAGNILGDHNGLSDECRLLLANAVAACYLSDPAGQHPTKQKLASFLTAQS